MADLILGLDPGTRRAGFGLISVEGDRLAHVSHGVIALKAEAPLAERLNALHMELRAILQRFSVRTVVVEKIFFGKNADSAFKLGHARGICLFAAAQAGVPLQEYAARYVKKCVTGSGAASKDHVQMIVLATLNMRPQPLANDASDALALAITHARLRDVSERMQRMREKEL